VPRSAAPVVWPAEALWEAVQPLLPGFTVEVLPEIDSTNSELMRRARAGQTEPILLVAQRQSAGRGRLGRQWADAGAAGPAALAFSLGLAYAPQDWAGLSLAVGLTVAQSLHPALRIKWPNDVWWEQRKLAGILIETANVGALRYVVIGVGVNIAQPAAHDFSVAPAGLEELLPGVDAPGALARIVLPLVHTVQRFETQGFAPFQPDFLARDLLRGETVQCSDGVTGVARGVDAGGALLLQTADGVKKIVSAEVSVRPVAHSAANPP